MMPPVATSSSVIFAEDELCLVPEYLEKEELLAQAAMFFLKDLLSPLELEPQRVRRHVKAIKDRGLSAYRGRH